jgi:predicted secreted protein
MLKKRLVNLCGIAILMAGSASFAKTQLVHDANKVVNITGNQTEFTVELPANATTGYSWVLQDNYNADLIVPVSYHYVVPDKKLVGAPGTAQWTFRVKKDALIVPTKMTVTLNYMRPWETAVAKTQTITVVTAAVDSSR